MNRKFKPLYGFSLPLKVRRVNADGGAEGRQGRYICPFLFSFSKWEGGSTHGLKRVRLPGTAIMPPRERRCTGFFVPLHTLGAQTLCANLGIKMPCLFQLIGFKKRQRLFFLFAQCVITAHHRICRLIGGRERKFSVSGRTLSKRHFKLPPVSRPTEVGAYSPVRSVPDPVLPNQDAP